MNNHKTSHHKLTVKDKTVVLIILSLTIIVMYLLNDVTANL